MPNHLESNGNSALRFATPLRTPYNAAAVQLQLGIDFGAADYFIPKAFGEP
jgi:hypothetical protein